MRKILSENKLSDKAIQQINDFHHATVSEIETAIAANEWVVVGMALNPFVVKAKALLTKRGIKFHYIEVGGYTSRWKQRLAIKLWSGWPTFPQVFHNSVLLGGYNELETYVKE